MDGVTVVTVTWQRAGVTAQRWPDDWGNLSPLCYSAICSHLFGAATDGAFPCLASLRINDTEFNLGSGKLLSGVENLILVETYQIIANFKWIILRMYFHLSTL